LDFNENETVVRSGNLGSLLSYVGNIQRDQLTILVDREHLRKYAENTDQRPSFLFPGPKIRVFDPATEPARAPPPPPEPKPFKPVLQVMSAEWRDAREGNHRVSSFAVLTIANQSPMGLSHCYVCVESVETGNQNQKIDKRLFLDGTTKNEFAVGSGQRISVNLTRRDLKDVINLPPHLIQLDDGGKILLDDGQTYLVTLSLRCPSPITTTAKIELTGDGEEITAKIVGQVTTKTS
jgi:hypothetical protein